MEALILLAALTLPQETEPQKGYVVMDARVVTSHYQPKMFAVMDEKKNKQHLSTNILIHELVPGEYRLLHFDYTTDFHDSPRDVVFSERVTFTVQSGVLNFLGRVSAKRKAKSSIVSFERGLDLLEKVCDENPSIIENEAVRFEGWSNEDRAIKLTCEEAA